MIEMVDRQEPFTRLKEVLDEVISGHGRVVLISGEAGIGKTRLVQELEGSASGKGVMFLYGRCLSPIGSEPYLPFLEALRDYSRKAPKEKKGGKTHPSEKGAAGNGETRDTRTMPMGLLGINDMFEGGGQEGGHDATTERIERLWRTDVGRERDRMYETISSTLLGMARDRPLLLFLDDLQWADSGTLQLLVHISRHVAENRVLIVCAYRFEEVFELDGRPHPLSEVMSLMEHQRISERIPLEGFKKEDTKQMLFRLLETKDIPAELVETIHDRTNGNPYFIEEVVKSLIERGIIDPKDHRWTTKSRLKDITIPSTVRDVIALRLSKLDARAMKTLERASVIGKEFSIDVLRGVSDAREEDLVDDLDLLIRSRVIMEETKGMVEYYRFASTVIREVVYDAISNVKRRLLHRKTANAIEDLVGEDSDEMVYVLAQHYALANDPDKSTKYTVRAGNKAFKSMALKEADRFYRTALESLERAKRTPENLTLKEEVLLSEGKIHFTVGEHDLALKELGEVLELCSETSHLKSGALAYYWIGRTYENRTDLESARDYLQRALELFRACSDLSGQSMDLQFIAMYHLRKGEYQKGLDLIRESVELAEKANDLGEMVSSHTLEAMLCSELGDFDRSEKGYRKAEELALKEGDPGKLSRIYNNWGDLRMRQWRYADAIPILERSLEPGKMSGNLRMLGYCYCNIGECMVHIGETAKGRPHLERARAIFEKLDEKLMISRLVMVDGVAYRKAKDWAKAREYGLKSIAMAETMNIPFAVGEYLMEYGISCKDEGVSGEAKPVLERAAKIFKEIGAKKFLEKTEEELGRLG